MFGRRQPPPLPTTEEALPGREEPWFVLPERHAVLSSPLVTTDVPAGLEVAVFGLGCFWGAEEIFWQLPGVWSTSVGYVGGHTPHPSYEEVCTGRTGHTEAVRVVYDPEQVGYETLVATFFEVHDPTQGMRQGNDVGSQYRSMILTTNATQEQRATELAGRYQEALTARGLGTITTEIRPLDAGEDSRYFYAEEVHQQYLHKVPHGYRCHANTGVPFPR